MNKANTKSALSVLNVSSKSIKEPGGYKVAVFCEEPIVRDLDQIWQQSSW